MSRAERFALAGALGLVIIQALLAVFEAAGPALEYQRAALAASPWRIVTAHFVHINTPHVVVNAAAWFVVARLFATELPPVRQIAVIIVASLAIGLGLAWCWPEIAWYRGFSGVLHALFFAGAAAWLVSALARSTERTVAKLWLPLALCVGGWIKVLWEQPAGGATPFAAWLDAATVPQAHLVGALCGTLLGVLFERLGALRSGLPARARHEGE